MVASQPTPSTAQLVDLVVENGGAPIDARAVAALLESLGLREADAARFGYRDLFALADQVYAAARARVGALRQAPKRPTGLRLPLPFRFVRNYVRGLLSALPMAGQIAVFLALGVSLWGWIGFSERLATTITLGAIASYLVTGGITQAMSRRGGIYMDDGRYGLARVYTARMLRFGVTLTLGIALLWSAGNLVFPALDLTSMMVTLTYFVLLSLLWLNLSLLYVLKQQLAALAAMLLGVAIVVGLFSSGRSSVVLAHTVGLATTAALMFAYGRFVLARILARAPAEAQLAKLPRDSILIFTATPYFLYGSLYFAFVFLDRIVAWSATRDPLPFLIWFRPPYEAGMDLALVALILASPVLEHALREIAHHLEYMQTLTRATMLDQFNRALRFFYLKQLALVATVASIALVAAISLVRRLIGAGIAAEFVTDPTVQFVFRAGVIGYLLLVWGLFNGMLIQAIGQPYRLLPSLAAALVVNLLVGYLLSRTLSYEYAVFGLVAGALTYGVLSTRLVLELLASIDYYYFARR